MNPDRLLLWNLTVMLNRWRRTGKVGFLKELEAANRALGLESPKPEKVSHRASGR